MVSNPYGVRHYCGHSDLATKTVAEYRLHGILDLKAGTNDPIIGHEHTLENYSLQVITVEPSNVSGVMMQFEKLRSAMPLQS